MHNVVLRKVFRGGVTCRGSKRSRPGLHQRHGNIRLRCGCPAVVLSLYRGYTGREPRMRRNKEETPRFRERWGSGTNKLSEGETSGGRNTGLRFDAPGLSEGRSVCGSSYRRRQQIQCLQKQYGSGSLPPKRQPP
ncbi:hypothetical protein M3J09_009617 [Ascochyta lentis]